MNHNTETNGTETSKSETTKTEASHAESSKYSHTLEITPHTEWSQDFWEQLVPAKNRVSQHVFFRDLAAGRLSLQCFRHALLNFYPLVAYFPSYMSMSLAKATAFQLPGVVEARNWLIQNIKVEERHLYWYRDWAVGFGLSIDALDQVKPPAAMNAVNHYLWSIGYQGSLAETIAATNLAIEWATGDWTIQVYKGIEAYARQANIQISPKMLTWLRAHAHYDDLHPFEAMELIKRLCNHDESMQQKALYAAQQGLAYYELALDECYKMQTIQSIHPVAH